jgi:hypothetical protein
LASLKRLDVALFRSVSDNGMAGLAFNILQPDHRRGGAVPLSIGESDGCANSATRPDWRILPGGKSPLAVALNEHVHCHF